MLTCRSSASFSAPSRLSESSCNIARRASVFCWARSLTCRKSRIRINCLSAPRNSARVLGSRCSLCPSVSRVLLTVLTALMVFPKELLRSWVRSRMPRSRRWIRVFSRRDWLLSRAGGEGKEGAASTARAVEAVACVAAAVVFGAVEFGGRRKKLNTECCVRWKESVSPCSESEVPSTRWPPGTRFFHSISRIFFFATSSK